MSDSKEAKKELVEELQALRARIAELERIEADHKWAEEALRENEQRYAKAEQIGHFGHWERNLVEDKASWSRECYRICGVDPNKFKPHYQDYLNLIHPSDREIFESAFEGAVSGSKPFDIEYRLVRPDGTQRVVHSVAEVRFDETGRPLKLVGTVQDITERKHAEEAVLKARDELEARVRERTASLSRANVLLKDEIAERERAEKELKQYQFMVQSAHDAIFFKDLKSRYIIANNKALEAFGLAREQVIGKNDYEIMPDKEQAGRNIEDDQSVFETRKPKEITKRMTGADGKERWFQAIKVPQFDDKANIIGLVGVARDITEHKQAEDALRQSENKYKTLLENLPQKIFLKDSNLVYVSCNENYARDLKIKPEEIAGRTDYDFFPRELAEKYRADDRAIIESAETKDIEERYIQDGQEAIVHTVKMRVRDAQGDVVGILGIFWDITEHKRAEEALRESEQRFRSLVETSSDWVWEVDRNGIYTYASPKVKDLLGYEPAEIIGKTPFDLMPPDEAERVAGLFKDIAEARKSFDRLENTNLHKDGGLVVLETSGVPILGEGENLLGYRGIDRDITERKKAEAALRESEEKFRTFMETASDLMNITDKDGYFTYVNEPTARTLGYSKEEMVGMHVTRILSEETKKHFEPRLKQLIAEGEVRVDSVWVTKEGREIYGETTVVAVYDSDGEFRGTRAIFRDISERKRAEEALQKARDELEIRVEQRTKELRSEISERKKAQEQLRSLASELALAEERLRRKIATDVHDHIGQNLAISKIKLESLRESASSPELADSLDEIGELIAQTIESSRSLTFELSPPVLYELGFEAAVEWLVRQTREQHALSTEFKNDGRAKPLDHDVRVLLFQAVRELLVNVAKHAKARNVTVSTKRIADEIQVSVEDDGVGFDTAKVGSRSYKTGGFGLFSIRERLGHIGGRLDVESRPKQGTRVTLVAPINHADENHKDKRK